MSGTHKFITLDHVQLAMPPGEEESARRFYADTLGMHELDKPALLKARGGAWFRAGSCEIHLGVEENFVAAKKAHPGVLVNGLRELAALLTERDHEVWWDDRIPDVARFFVEDPFGNRLEFLSKETSGCVAGC